MTVWTVVPVVAAQVVAGRRALGRAGYCLVPTAISVFIAIVRPALVRIFTSDAVGGSLVT